MIGFGTEVRVEHPLCPIHRPLVGGQPTNGQVLMSGAQNAGTRRLGLARKQAWCHGGTALCRHGTAGD